MTRLRYSHSTSVSLLSRDEVNMRATSGRRIARNCLGCRKAAASLTSRRRAVAPGPHYMGHGPVRATRRQKPLQGREGAGCRRRDVVETGAPDVRTARKNYSRLRGALHPRRQLPNVIRCSGGARASHATSVVPRGYIALPRAYPRGHLSRRPSNQCSRRYRWGIVPED